MSPRARAAAAMAEEAGGAGAPREGTEWAVDPARNLDYWQLERGGAPVAAAAEAPPLPPPPMDARAAARLLLGEPYALYADPTVSAPGDEVRPSESITAEQERRMHERMDAMLAHTARPPPRAPAAAAAATLTSLATPAPPRDRAWVATTVDARTARALATTVPAARALRALLAPELLLPAGDAGKPLRTEAVLEHELRVAGAWPIAGGAGTSRARAEGAAEAPRATLTAASADAAAPLPAHALRLAGGVSLYQLRYRISHDATSLMATLTVRARPGPEPPTRFEVMSLVFSEAPAGAPPL